jgi:GTPase
MDSPNFIDYVRFFGRSGHGGAGSAHFRREKHVPKGGPDGGDGGRGGHLILRGNQQMWTLLHLKYRKHIHASDGNSGMGARKSGADGDDVVLEVPLGTVAREAGSGRLLAEIVGNGEEVVLLSGGRGGLGNHHFKTSTNQAPRYAQPGEPGIEMWVDLELKLLADVGLVGFPNAGKSTLLSVLSAARPRIADYPFTTLVPNLGVVSYRDDRSFVMADIPGLIEGAADGKGLGHRFLRHIERNSLLLFLIPADTKDPVADYRVLLNELKRFNPELLDKKRVLAISKCDLLDRELMAETARLLPGDVPFVMISALTDQGLDRLKDLVWKQLTAG